MSKLLEGKVAIVTGAGRGLGREEVLALAREDARIFSTTLALWLIKLSVKREVNWEKYLRVEVFFIFIVGRQENSSSGRRKVFSRKGSRKRTCSRPPKSIP